MNIAITNLMR